MESLGTADKRGAPKSIRFKHIQTVEKAECEPPTIATLGQRPSFCCSNCMPALESTLSELTSLDCAGRSMGVTPWNCDMKNS